MLIFGHRPSLKVYWWRYDEAKHGNFGDEITPLILRNIFRLHVIWAPPEECDLIGAGSILQDMAKVNLRPGCIVWGSGFIEKSNITFDDESSLVLGVRGEKSKARLAKKRQSKKIFLGDPGLLASKAVRKKRPKYLLGIVPHYVDLSHPLVKHLSRQSGVLVIDPTQPCASVLQQISSCKSILSSSLHGLIVADSYAIPNQHIILSDKVRGGEYKFQDYYSVFENRSYKSLSTEELDTFTDAAEVCNRVMSDYQPIDNLNTLQQSIMRPLHEALSRHKR